LAQAISAPSSTCFAKEFIVFRVGAMTSMLTFFLPVLMVAAERPQLKTVPKFVIDLDVAPQERWKEVVAYYRDSGYLEALYKPDSPLFKKGVHHFVQREFLQAAAPLFDEEYLGEVDGWIKYGNNSFMTRERVMEFNMLYEANYPSFCSGLLAAKPDGTVVHGRNLDWWLTLTVRGKQVGWPELTADITMLKGGKPFMNSIHWPTQLSLATAMRYGGWTFEQNTRRPKRDAGENLAALRQGGRLFGLEARRIMERVPDYETAVETLWNTSWAAPQYFIVSGPKPYQGVVLSVDRLGQHLPSSPPPLRLDPLRGKWYLLQTNDDEGKPSHDIRRPNELRKLELASQADVSAGWVLDQMTSLPLLVKDTAFTWVAEVASGTHEALLPPPLTVAMRARQGGLAAKGAARNLEWFEKTYASKLFWS